MGVHYCENRNSYETLITDPSEKEKTVKIGLAVLDRQISHDRSLHIDIESILYPQRLASPNCLSGYNIVQKPLSTLQIEKR